MITEYIRNGNADRCFDFILEALEIFTVERKGEAENYLKDLGNKQLLWVGADLNDYAGILSQGLRLPPAEAPENAYMFGKGIYFSDIAPKAVISYSPNQKDEVLLLCEVALGECNEKFEADLNAANLPLNKHR